MNNSIDFKLRKSQKDETLTSKNYILAIREILAGKAEKDEFMISQNTNISTEWFLLHRRAGQNFIQEMKNKKFT